MAATDVLHFFWEEGKTYFSYLNNRLTWVLSEGGVNTAIDNAVRGFYNNLSSDDPILTTSHPHLRELYQDPERMKEAVKRHLRRYKRISLDNAVRLEYMIRRRKVWDWETRLPDDKSALPDYKEFMFQYMMIKHPRATFEEAYNEFRRDNPSLWSNPAYPQ